MVATNKASYLILCICIELTDEILDQYIIEELFPFWEKLGKALKIPNRFLEDLPADPADRLKAILSKWQTTEDHPLVSTLNKKLKQLGLNDFIPQLTRV